MEFIDQLIDYPIKCASLTNSRHFLCSWALSPSGLKLDKVPSGARIPPKSATASF